MSGSTIEEALAAAIASSGSAGARSIEQSSPAIKIILPKRLRDAPGTSSEPDGFARRR